MGDHKSWIDQTSRLLTGQPRQSVPAERISIAAPCHVPRSEADGLKVKRAIFGSAGMCSKRSDYGLHWPSNQPEGQCSGRRGRPFKSPDYRAAAPALAEQPLSSSGDLMRMSALAPFQARENVGAVVLRGRMLSSVRPLMRQEDSRRPVWEFVDRVQITRSVLEAQWKALVVPAPSRRLLRHTLLPLALTSSRSWSVYAATTGVL